MAQFLEKMMASLNVSRWISCLGVCAMILLAACSPTATTPTSVPNPGGETLVTPVSSTETENTDGSSSDAAAVVKDFYVALFGGDDASGFICSKADAAEVQQIHRRVADAYAGAAIDTSLLTFEAGAIEDDKTLVMINGTLSADQNGVKTEIPVVVPPVSVELENGSWKVCPAS